MITFDYSKHRQELIDNLRGLASLPVKEYTFLKKWEEIQTANESLVDYANQAKANIWKPTDIYDESLTVKEISDLQPRMVVVDSSKERLWSTLRIFCSSAEFNQSPGRFIRFLLIDDVSNKVLGIVSVVNGLTSITIKLTICGKN